MPKRKSSGKMGIILAVISAIPAILAIVRAMKESRESLAHFMCVKHKTHIPAVAGYAFFVV